MMGGGYKRPKPVKRLKTAKKAAAGKKRGR